jgi:hypothetical protein
MRKLPVTKVLESQKGVQNQGPPLRKQNTVQMHRTLLLLAMAYGVRRNEANGDCPGFKGNGVCEWGATRQSGGRGRAPRPT